MTLPAVKVLKKKLFCRRSPGSPFPLTLWLCSSLQSYRVINGGASLLWRGHNFPHNVVLTLTLTSFFPPGNSVWVTLEVGTTLSQPLPVFMPSELRRLAQASLQTGGHPSHKALEEVFKFAQAKKFCTSEKTHSEQLTSPIVGLQRGGGQQGATAVTQSPCPGSSPSCGLWPSHPLGQILHPSANPASRSHLCSLKSS